MPISPACSSHPSGVHRSRALGLRRAPTFDLRRSRRFVLAVLGTICLVVSTFGSAGAASAAPPTRAMWVWTQADPAAVVDFAQTHGVSTLFVAVGSDVATSGDLPRLQRLVAIAHGAGIRVDALGGDPSWATNQTPALAWEKAVLGTGLFSGVHVDVEPYALPGWSTPKTQTKIISSYLSMLSALRQGLRGTGLPLEADVAFWYGTVPLGRSTLADEVLSRVDALTVMSYRDTATGPNSITDVGADLLARGAAAGRPVRLAAETNPLADCPACTFYEEGEPALQAALATVDGVEASSPAYAGMAVEDYDGWATLAGRGL